MNIDAKEIGRPSLYISNPEENWGPKKAATGKRCDRRLAGSGLSSLFFLFSLLFYLLSIEYLRRIIFYYVFFSFLLFRVRMDESEPGKRVHVTPCDELSTSKSE